MDTKMILKGMRVPLVGLLDQARAHVALEQQYGARLRERGWTDEHRARLLDGLASLEGDRVAAIDARHDSKGNLEREHAAVSDGKKLKRELVHAFDDLFHEHVVDADTRTTIVGKGRLDRSAPLVSSYLGGVRSVVSANDKALAPYFGGQSALARLDAAKAELDAAQAKQETDSAALPQETQKVYEAKGRLLATIEKMNRLAKLAFDGDAQTIALFNKDLILRAVRHRRVADAAKPVEQGKTA